MQLYNRQTEDVPITTAIETRRSCIIREKNGLSPLITVWGGEPLVSPLFEDLLTILSDRSFETEVITNGVLIDRHKEVIEGCVGKLYVSVDGTREIHDAVRGNGVYEKVIENLRNLRHKNVTVMSVITEGLVNALPEFLKELSALNIKELLLQDMIGLSENEIKAYKAMLKDEFQVNALNIESWRAEGKTDFSAELEKKLSECGLKTLGFKVLHKKHTKEKVCKSPFTHPHIAWNGNLLYCTDFYDFSAGNVKEESLEKIFRNKKSEKFRKLISEGKCVTCNHCSWRTL